MCLNFCVGLLYVSQFRAYIDPRTVHHYFSGSEKKGIQIWIKLNIRNSSVPDYKVYRFWILFLFKMIIKNGFRFNSNCYILTFFCAAQIKTRSRKFLEKRMQIHNKNNSHTFRFDIRVVGIYLFVTVRPSSKFHTLPQSYHLCWNIAQETVGLVLLYLFGFEGKKLSEPACRFPVRSRRLLHLSWSESRDETKHKTASQSGEQWVPRGSRFD